MRQLEIRDVRAAMPNYERYRPGQHAGPVRGIAVHHSGAANHVTGVSTDDARTIFRYHVETLGWERGGYHYLIRPTGLVEYALDEQIPANHAGVEDPDDRLGLERGQYWNNHMLAVCLLGWFEQDRVPVGGHVAIPNRFTTPAPAQWRALVELLRQLGRRYRLDAEAVWGHRELTGCRTRCPGANVDLEALRATLRMSEDSPGP